MRTPRCSRNSSVIVGMLRRCGSGHLVVLRRVGRELKLSAAHKYGCNNLRLAHAAPRAGGAPQLPQEHAEGVHVRRTAQVPALKGQFEWSGGSESG